MIRPKLPLTVCGLPKNIHDLGTCIARLGRSPHNVRNDAALESSERVEDRCRVPRRPSGGAARYSASRSGYNKYQCLRASIGWRRPVSWLLWSPGHLVRSIGEPDVG